MSVLSWVRKIPSKLTFWNNIKNKYNVSEENTKHNEGTSTSVSELIKSEREKGNYKFYNQEKEQNNSGDNVVCLDQNIATSNKEVEKDEALSEQEKNKFTQNYTKDRAHSDTEKRDIETFGDQEKKMQDQLSEKGVLLDKDGSPLEQKQNTNILNQSKDKPKDQSQLSIEEKEIETFADNENETQNQPSKGEVDKDGFSLEQEQNTNIQYQFIDQLQLNIEEKEIETSTGNENETQIQPSKREVEKDGSSLEQNHFKDELQFNIEEKEIKASADNENKILDQSSKKRIFFTGAKVKPSTPQKQEMNFFTGAKIKPSTPQKQEMIFFTGAKVKPSTPKKSEIHFFSEVKVKPSTPQKQEMNFFTGTKVKPSTPKKSEINFFSEVKVKPSTPQKQEMNFFTGAKVKHSALKKSEMNFFTGTKVKPSALQKSETKSTDKDVVNQQFEVNETLDQATSSDTEKKDIKTSGDKQNEMEDQLSEREVLLDKDGSQLEQEQNSIAQDQEKKEETNTSVVKIDKAEVLSATEKIEKEDPSQKQKQNATENTRESNVYEPSKEEKEVILVAPEETDKNNFTPKISEEDKPEAPEREIHNVEDEPLKLFNIHQEYFSDNFDLKIIDTYDIPTKISTIKSYAETLHDKVHNFNEEMYSIDYFVLDEKLMQLVEKLNKIKCNSNENYTKKKIEAITYITGLHSTLDANAKEES